MRNLVPIMLITGLLIGLQFIGCFEDEDTSCLQGSGTNASARVDGKAVDFLGSGKMARGISPTPTGPVWTSQFTLTLYISKAECSHGLTFWVDNPMPGEAILTGNVQDGVANFTGVYSGELGSGSLREGSTLSITSFGSTASGTFKGVLEDGTVFSNGEFQGIPVH